MDNTGPLFAGPPGAHGIPWLALIPVLLAIPACALLLLGLIRGKLPPSLAGAALFLPIAAYGLAALHMLEDSKQTTFCGSCHLMTPLLNSLGSNDGSLASIHYTRGLVPHEEACFTCHSGYGIWGTTSAKMAGVMHMVRTVTGRYELPLRINGTFDIDSCLGCHAHAASFRSVAAHQDPDLQQMLVSREMGCTGTCHPAAHPDSALGGAQPSS